MRPRAMMGVHEDEPTDTTESTDRLDELVARTAGLQPWRRVFHGASAVALALAPEALGLDHVHVVAVLGALLVAAVVVDLARLRSRRLNVVFFRLLTPLASPREAGGPASSTWYLLGALLVWAFLPDQAVPGILVLGLADPAAAVVGRRWGRHPVGKGSLEGLTVFLAVALAVLIPTSGGAPALVAAVVATAVEVLPLPLDDNLTVPVATATVLAALGG